MKVLKKVLLGVLSLACAVAMAVGLSACEYVEEYLHQHEFGEWIVFNAEVSCDQRIFYRVCEGCGEKEGKIGSAEDHIWEIVTEEATCTSLGIVSNVCSLCGAVESTSYTEKKEHIWAETYTVAYIIAPTSLSGDKRDGRFLIRKLRKEFK